MSNSHLRVLAEEAKAILSKSEDARTEFYNRQTHVYSVNRQSIIRESLVQIGRARDSITEEELSELTIAATNYCKRLHAAFTSQAKEGFIVQAKSNINFYVIINTGIDAYRKIYNVRVSEKGGLRKFTNDLHRIFPESRKVHTVAFDVGHKAGSSVAELTIQKALEKFSSVPKVSGSGARTINKVISLAIRSQETKSAEKVFTIEVKDESAVENQRKGREDEKRWIKETREALNQLIKTVDWPNQKGSRSAIEAAISELLTSGKKAKGKITGKITKKSGASKVKTTLQTSKRSSRSKQITIPLPIMDIGSKGREVTNWSSLIPIINNRLPDQVSANMNAPGLVRRTGTLAESAKVVNIEKTREGYPSVVFNYQRDPYDVFDRVKGASPWNTPERDPRTLVDKSVREIVRELAIGRFYTRRA